MKNKSICIVLLLVLAMICSPAKAAIWNPDTDPNLIFNLNFETDTNGPPPTTTSNPHPGDGNYTVLVGTASDYNTTDPFHMWDSNVNERKIGNYSGDFRKLCDANTGKTYDCRVSVPSNPIFDLGALFEDPTTKKTFTLWFYPEIQTATGTMIRHAYVDEPNSFWEIRMYDGKLQFWSKMGIAGVPLRMETTKTLAQLEVQANSWHHAGIVYDRSAREASLIFVDGVQVDRTVISHDDTNTIGANVDPGYTSPVIFGTGDSEFEGMLDECRIYKRTLTPSEVSILYQTDYTTKAIALSPFPNASNVPVDTNLLWQPVAAATRQTLYFNDDSDVCTSPLYTVSGANDLNSVANASIGGPLTLNTTYYWAVDTNVSGTMYKGPVWKFTTETGKAFNPVPANGEEDVNVGAVDLQWSASSSASRFDVYFADNFDRVNDVNADALEVNDITDTNFAVNAPVKGETYYWRIVTKFPAGTGLPDVTGDVWNFRTKPQLVIVNTSDAGAIYNEVNYPAKTLTFVDDSCVVNGYLGDDDVVIFDYNANLNLNEYYSIIVIPEFNDTVEADMNSQGYRKTSRPMAIHVNGDAFFNCRIEAYAPDAPLNDRGPSSQARSGGYRGSYRYEDHNNPIEKFGPGYGATGGESDVLCGAGGGYGGAGGNQARGGLGGVAYGYTQIPVPLGGSAGGWSNNATAGGGGGAVEIAATGNVTLGSEMQLLVSGGKALPAGRGSGGGAGGSVKIIARGNFTNSGVVDANGGKGGDTTILTVPGSEGKANPGGGGGGGRIAVFHAGSYTNTGTLAVAGGARGGRPEEDQNTASQAGAVGTVFESNQTPLKPEYPTPADGANGIMSGGKVTLKWYPGFGAKKNELYFGTSTNPPKIIEINGVPAKGGVLRAQQTYDVNAVAGQTYYWYVKAKSDTNEVNSTSWSFLALYDYMIVFNTSDVNATYSGQIINPLTCRIRDSNGWEPAVISTGSVGADGVTIFNFNGFNYDANYTIVVVPDYTCTGKSTTTEVPSLSSRRPLAIHVAGDFYFDGTLDISGDDVLTAADRPKARSGGYRGTRMRGSSADDFDDYSEYDAGYFTVKSDPNHRYSLTPAAQLYYPPTDSGRSVFGPGIGLIAVYDGGGGGGYGGIGGDSGRGYYYGLFAGGPSYGDKEVPVPFGGSAGGYGKETGGGAGGGGVEIAATGSVTFGSNAEIYSEGGSVLFYTGRYSGAGGAGGSVRIIAGTTFTNNGIIDVNGGKGGDSSYRANEGGGGGGGGRVSIYYGSGTPVQGTITAKGGARGLCQAADPCHYLKNLSEPGQDGTVFVSNGSPAKASAPAPKNGDTMVYCPNSSPTQSWLTLKWYSGYNVTSVNDVVYFGTASNPTTQIGAPVPATRGQHSSTVDVNIVPDKTYYWKVTTAGTVNSDIWSFKTVNWQCQMPDANVSPVIDGWPEWDFNHDCVVNFIDFASFAERWRAFAEVGSYDLTLPELIILMTEWMECQGRTNSGCSGSGW